MDRKRLRVEYSYEPAGDPWRRFGVSLDLTPASEFMFTSDAVWPISVTPTEIELCEAAIERACRQLLNETIGFSAVRLVAVKYDPVGTSQMACFVATRNAIETQFGLRITWWNEGVALFKEE